MTSPLQATSMILAASLGSGVGALPEVQTASQPSCAVNDSVYDLRAVTQPINAVIKAGIHRETNRFISEWLDEIATPLSALKLSMSLLITADDLEAAKAEGKSITDTVAKLANIIHQDAAETVDRETNRFISELRHEIATPLNALKLSMYLLKTADDLEAVKEEGEAIASTVAELANIIDNMHLLSLGDKDMTESYRSVELSLQCQIKETIDLLTRWSALDGRKCSYSVDPNLPDNLLGPREPLNQIFINLILNAAKFSPGGEIEVTVRRLPNAESNEGLWLQFSIADNGIGIPPDQLERIFEPGIQGDHTRGFQGTGQGLAIIKKLLRPMSGRIWAESEGLGKGATFHFTALLKKESLSVAVEQLGFSRVG